MQNMSELVDAAVEQNFQEVKRLVESGADVNQGNSYDTTALHCVAQSGSLEIVKYLAEHGADVNCKNWRNETALQYAAKSGSLEIVEYLVENGADMNCLNTSNRTNLHFAVECNSLEMVKYLVEHGAKVTREDCHVCDTVLYRACSVGNELIVDYLLQNGAIKDINKRKWTSPLNVACLGGHTAVVQTLLKYGVDIRQEKRLKCNVDDIMNILTLELKKSIKHLEKIQILKDMDEEKTIKVICSQAAALRNF